MLLGIFVVHLPAVHKANTKIQKLNYPHSAANQPVPIFYPTYIFLYVRSPLYHRLLAKPITYTEREGRNTSNNIGIEDLSLDKLMVVINYADNEIWHTIIIIL